MNKPQVKILDDGQLLVPCIECGCTRNVNFWDWVGKTAAELQGKCRYCETGEARPRVEVLSSGYTLEDLYR